LGLPAMTFLWRQAEYSRKLEKAQSGARITALARSAWLNNDVPLARDLLAECPEPFRDREWHHLHRACTAELFKLDCRSLFVGNCCFAQGHELVLASRDHDGLDVRVWDFDKEPDARTWLKMKRDVFSMSTLSDGRMVIAWQCTTAGDRFTGTEV